MTGLHSVSGDCRTLDLAPPDVASSGGGALAQERGAGSDANQQGLAGTNAPSKFRSAEDGWLDISGFLDADFGFLPVVLPISEPAVGYGAAAGPAFLSKSPGASRPNVTAVGGLGTQNGTWGVVAADSRYWLDGKLQTLVGAAYASVNLDYYGIGENRTLAEHPLSYNLEPKGGLVQAKYRIGDSDFWAGLSYAFFSTKVSFETSTDTSNLPELHGESNVGGVGPSVSFDTRDNIFTPTRGTYAEVLAGLGSQAFGGDGEFQRVQLLAMQYVPLLPRLFLYRSPTTASRGAETSQNNKKTQTTA